MLDGFRSMTDVAGRFRARLHSPLCSPVKAYDESDFLDEEHSDPVKAYVQSNPSQAKLGIGEAKAIDAQACPSAGNRAESMARARKDLHRECPAPLKGTPGRQERFSLTREDT